MGLLDDLNNSENFKTNNGAKCKICELLKELDEKSADSLIKRLEQPKMKTSDTALADVLTKNGYPISRASIGRHRKACMNVA